MVSFALSAQHQKGFSFALQFPIKLSEKFELHNDGGIRLRGDNMEVYQILYRSGLRYYFNKQYSTAAGFALFFTDGNLSSDEKKMGAEFRLWEEFMFQKSYPKDKILLRFRGEQRFFDDYGKKQSYGAERLRLLTQYTKKIYGNWSLQTSNEYFYQFRANFSQMDQDRIIVNAVYSNEKHHWELRTGFMEVIYPNKKYTDNLMLGISKKL